ncbi:S-adenosyl-L-methionine-dependent methyltransferase [Epithele typhae]|uniref:S-adenosyl-L-methionine-dependent methyltransferase n=1 Tax=Epithele typhae TaxID=378194 RepID=UPI0020079E96|nr:S-adenosyl-L-methionine-dependent methyltransferase [Epithele typhae]KAH9925876.1 S-adenosyl-L-methionine-dependent methyltransferase [Epithele typhae]
MTIATLRALHAAIGTALDDIERVYSAQALDFPSLDAAFYATAPHTPEEDGAEALRGDPEVDRATKHIVAACGQMSALVHKPWFGLMADAQAGQLAAAIRFMETANVVEILKEAGPEGMHVKDIYDAILDLLPKNVEPKHPNGLNPVGLSHILRLLATAHYLREVKPDVFTNNRRSSYIDSGKTVAQLRDAPHTKYTDTDGVAAFVALWHVPRVFCFGRTSPDAPAPDSDNLEVAHSWAPFNLAFETKLGYFPWLELPENKDRLNRFGHAMTGTRQWDVQGGILRGFSWDELPEGAVLVDVGGGIGAQSIQVAEAHPHVRVLVEDRIQVTSAAVSAWGPDKAPLFESGRMAYRARDFLAPFAPPLEGAAAPAVFLLRLVLHDWQDQEAVKILRHLREAAGPDTKLLVGDMLLPYACHAPGSQSGEDDALFSVSKPFVDADSPLLPNLGRASIPGYLIDIMMMGMFDAREKAVGEMAALLLSAGWKVAEVRRSTPGALWAYTTAVPV